MHIVYEAPQKDLLNTVRAELNAYRYSIGRTEVLSDAIHECNTIHEEE